MSTKKHICTLEAVKYCMNLVFTAIVLVSSIILIFTNPSEVFPSMIEGVGGAIDLCFKLCAIYAVWLSVLKIMEKTGLDSGLARLLRPVIRRLFKGESAESEKWISVNLASNMLGMGGASTPAGIKAMASMDKGEKATANMDLLVVINATSIQLIPATIIALRASAGSGNPSSIIAPTLISSTIATVVGVVLTKLFSKDNADNKPSITQKLKMKLYDFIKRIKTKISTKSKSKNHGGGQ